MCEDLGEGVEDRYARETGEDSSQAWEEVCPDMQELSDGLGPHHSPFFAFQPILPPFHLNYRRMLLLNQFLLWSKLS